MRNLALKTAVTLAVAPLAVMTIGPAAADAATIKRGYAVERYEDGSAKIYRYEHGRPQLVARAGSGTYPWDCARQGNRECGQPLTQPQPKRCTDVLVRRATATVISCTDGSIGWRKPTARDLTTLPRL